MSALGDLLHRIVDAVGLPQLHADVDAVVADLEAIGRKGGQMLQDIGHVDDPTAAPPPAPDTATTLGPRGRDGVEGGNPE